MVRNEIPCRSGTPEVHSSPMDFPKAVLSSLWPQKLRKWWLPESAPMFIRATVVSGVIEFNLFGYLEFLQFRKHFLAVANHFAQGNVGTQTAALFVVAGAEFFYPLSLLLIFLTAEGFLRAIAAAILGETLPSFPVTLVARLWGALHRDPSHMVVR